MFYIRTFLMGLWFLVCTFTCLGKALFRWGDPSLDRDFGRMFASMTQKITRISIEVEGEEYLEAEKPCIYTSNHQSNFDIAVYGKICPSRTVVIGKKELVWVPVFGLFALAAGNIMIDRKRTDKAKDVLAQIVGEIKSRNVSVWVFPEGTRNRSGEGLLPFKKGAFHMAIAAQVPIVVCVASPVKPVADWKNRKLPGGKMQLKILPPFPTTGLTEADVNDLTNTIREKMLETLAEMHSERRVI